MRENMSPQDFCYWLRGLFELSNPENLKTLNERQVALIQRHLILVFKNETDPSNVNDCNVKTPLGC
jgi:hypothetical protein